jgi:hypothetical protein
VLEEMVVVSV